MFSLSLRDGNAARIARDGIGGIMILSYYITEEGTCLVTENEPDEVVQSVMQQLKACQQGLTNHPEKM